MNLNQNALHKKILQNVTIFDLDGCVSNDSGRLHLIKDLADAGEDHDKFDDYHKESINDAPLEVGDKVLRDLLCQNACVVFATARPEKWRLLTWDWLKLNYQIDRCNADVRLLMRQDGDMRGSPDVKAEMLSMILNSFQHSGISVVRAFDDREDVVRMYTRMGILAGVMNAQGIFPLDCSKFDLAIAAGSRCQQAEEKARQPVSAADILAKASDTFRERNANYKDNAVLVGDLMKVLFPEGVTLTSAADHHFYHLFELMMVKLTRFVKSGLKHEDSMHDLMVYAAMLEALQYQHDIKIG